MPRPPRSSIVVASLLAALPVHADLVHRWNFEGTGAAAADVVGGAHAGLMGGATLDGSGAVKLDGVDDFVDLPNGIVSSLTDATFEAWLTWDSTAPIVWQRVFDFGNSTAGEGNQSAGTNYLMLTPASSSWDQAMFSISTTGSQGEQRAFAPITLPSGAPTHVTVTFVDGDRATLFIDGAFMGSVAVSISLSQIDDVNNWLGRSQWAQDPNLRATLSEFRIHDEALSEAQVALSFAAGPDLPGLVGHPSGLSISGGGTQTLELTAGPAHAGDPYLLLGTFSGTSPGIPVDGLVLPINIDAYTLATLMSPNTPPLTGSFGTLSASGTAIAALTLPPAAAQALVPGILFHHAFVVLDVATVSIVFASNAAVCTMLP